MIQVDDNAWPICAAATHAVLRSGCYVSDRLVIRVGPKEQILVCAEVKSPKGNIDHFGERLDNRAAILTAMRSISKQFLLPA